MVSAGSWAGHIQVLCSQSTAKPGHSEGSSRTAALLGNAASWKGEASGGLKQPGWDVQGPGDDNRTGWAQFQHTPDQHSSLDQRKPLQTFLLQMLKPGTNQIMTRASKTVTVKGDRAQRTCRPGRTAPAHGIKLSPASPAAKAAAPAPHSMDTRFPTRTAPCQGAQQPWLKPSCKHRASWGQSGTWSCSKAPRGP